MTEKPSLMEKIKTLGPKKLILIAVIALGGIILSNVVADTLEETFEGTD
jgi:hypothetical protein